jgi:hypothetical protein
MVVELHERAEVTRHGVVGEVAGGGLSKPSALLVNGQMHLSSQPIPVVQDMLHGENFGTKCWGPAEKAFLNRFRRCLARGERAPPKYPAALEHNSPASLPISRSASESTPMRRGVHSTAVGSGAGTRAEYAPKVTSTMRRVGSVQPHLSVPLSQRSGWRISKDRNRAHLAL